MKQLLKSLTEESRSTFARARDAVPRRFAFPKTEKLIKVAIGMRRTGKTYFLYQYINQLLDQGISEDRILYINFEDDRLLPLDTKKMATLIEDFYTLYPDNHNKCCYLFFDEVQNVPNWEIVVRRFFDSKDVQIYLTGSSAKLLSKEIATSLRGRSLAIEIWPYDFSEYLVAHDVQLPKKPWGKKSIDIMQKHLLNFFKIG